MRAGHGCSRLEAESEGAAGNNVSGKDVDARCRDVRLLQVLKRRRRWSAQAEACQDIACGWVDDANGFRNDSHFSRAARQSRCHVEARLALNHEGRDRGGFQAGHIDRGPIIGEDDHEVCARVGRIRDFVHERAYATLDQCGFAIEGTGRERITTQVVGGIDIASPAQLSGVGGAEGRTRAFQCGNILRSASQGHIAIEDRTIVGAGSNAHDPGATVADQSDGIGLTSAGVTGGCGDENAGINQIQLGAVEITPGRATARDGVVHDRNGRNRTNDGLVGMDQNAGQTSRQIGTAAAVAACRATDIIRADVRAVSHA